MAIDELISKLSDPAIIFNRPPEKKVIILDGVKELQNRKARRKLYSYYPEEGQLSRHNYPRHMEFFAAGQTFRERLMLAANRVGRKLVHNLVHS